MRPQDPAFCPRCGSAPADGQEPGGLCPSCGDPLRPQGYCPICERFLRIEVGADCPKHEVELVAEAPRAEPFAPVGERPSLVTVATYPHPNLATGPRIRLEAEGIPTFLDGERVAGNTLYQVATGGVRLQVPASLATEARVLIAQTWTPPPIDDDDDLEDAWEDLAPEPGARRRLVMKVAILLFLFGPGLVALATLIQSRR